MGFWDDNYIPLSLILDNQVISNVSVNRMELVISNEWVKAVQIGTVMTKNGYRGRGYAGELIKTALDKYGKEAELIFLFPNEDALDFYKKFGFNLIYDNKYSVNEIKMRQKPKKIIKLSMDSDKDRCLIERVMKNSIPQSNIFDVFKGGHVRMWHFVYELKDDLFYLPQKDSVIAFRIEEDVMNIYEVMSERSLDLMKIIGYIASENAQRVKLYFTPDKSFLKEGKLAEEQNNPFMYPFREGLTVCDCRIV
jgi:N-acetylglutamate synthase-like GNAT family acetyltransferase